MNFSSFPLSYFRVLWFFPLLALTLAGCGDDSLPAGLSGTIDTVLVSPDPATIEEGQTLALSATPLNEAGEPTAQDESIFWESEDSLVARVNGVGRVTGVRPGEVEIRARIGSALGSSSLTVERGPGNVETIEVEPPEARLETGQQQEFTAIVKDSSGNVLDDVTIVWRSSEKELATINQEGVATAHAQGNVIIRAMREDIKGTARLNIEWAPITRVEVSPQRDSLEVGDRREFQARAYDASGNQNTDADFQWVSTNENIASINLHGELKALAPGRTDIIARSEGHADTARVVVKEIGVDSIAVQPARDTVEVDQSTQFNAIAFDQEGNELSDVEFNWGSSDPAVATVNSTGEATGQAEGTTTITASAEGESGEATLVVIPGDGDDDDDNQGDVRYIITPYDQSTATLSQVSLELTGSPESEFDGNCERVALSRGQVARFPASELPTCIEITETARSTTNLMAGWGQAGLQMPLRSSGWGPQARELIEEGRIHHELLQRQRRSYQRLGPAAGSPASAGLQAQAQQDPLPQEGDVVDFRVPRFDGTRLCNDFDEVSARTIMVGTRAVAFIDTTTTTDIESQVQDIVDEFDDLQFDILANNFGDPLQYDDQLDDNDRIFMLFTDQVNVRGGGQVAGFVSSTDMQARTDCASSTEGEIFYARVPSSGEPADTWQNRIRSTIIHEGKHLVANAARFSMDAAQLEEAWIEEATAMISEEIWAREIFGYGPQQNLTFNESVGQELQEDSPQVMIDHFALLSLYLQEPENISPVGPNQSGDFITFRGPAWLMTRWAADHFANSESTFFTDLTQTTRTGIENFETVSGESFGDLYTRYFPSIPADDHPSGLALDLPELEHPSWNLRDIYEGLHNNFNNDDFFPRPWPLQARTQQLGSFTVSTDIRGGTNTFLDLSGSLSNDTQIIEIGGSSNLGISILRIQ